MGHYGNYKAILIDEFPNLQMHGVPWPNSVFCHIETEVELTIPDLMQRVLIPCHGEFDCVQQKVMCSYFWNLKLMGDFEMQAICETYVLLPVTSARYRNSLP
jgi:hypothetical protein